MGKHDRAAIRALGEFSSVLNDLKATAEACGFEITGIEVADPAPLKELAPLLFTGTKHQNHDRQLQSVMCGLALLPANKGKAETD